MAEQYSETGDIIEPVNAYDDIYAEPIGEDKLYYKYPLHDESRHYIKFWIHVDEQSSIWKSDKNPKGVEIGEYVELTEQNRLNRGLASRDIIQDAAAVAGGIAAGSKMIQRAMTNSFRGKLSVGTIAAGVAGGAAAGAVTGYIVGGIAAEKFHMTKRLRKLKHTIDLYTPAGISTGSNIRWDATDDMLINLAQSDTWNAVGESLKRAMKNPGAALDAASGAVEILAASNSTVSNLSRTALNPRKDVLFKDVGQRTFQFDFQFAARSRDEANAINQIIFAFRMFSHPEVLKGYGQFLALYPAEFDIDYMFIDNDGKHIKNPHLVDISSCVCTNVNVSYAANGSYQSLMNGEPTIVNLSLRFMEIEVLHQRRIAAGY